MPHKFYADTKAVAAYVMASVLLIASCYDLIVEEVIIAPDSGGVGWQGSFRLPQATCSVAGTPDQYEGIGAIYLAADKIIEKGKRIAAHLLEAQAADLEFADGRFTIVGTDRALSLKEIAAASFVPMRLPPGFDGGLYESATYAPSKDTYPNGCHVCEVEIDPETGDVAILNYVIIDDVGTVVNPLTLKGQIHGGIAQGLGQILMERVVYDDESGQLVTASFMDYAMPRADVFSHITVKSNPVPTKLNPLGAKGAGEAGCVGSLPSVMNAVMNALESVGVRQLDMPVTSDRVWKAIRIASKENRR